ncbi:MAG: serine/threonine protein kinase [Deltaproteobacteria bacterium]|nr:serine/threonine protein kinase [Deltaproteobacteria bacterium]
MSAASRYRLIRSLGSGGMAQVYEAVALGAEGFERRVAVKRILPQLASDAAVRRMFLDEARIASRLHHGNVVPVLDFGIVDGTELLVMEHVDGLDARAAVRGSLAAGIAVEPGVALHIAAEIAHALAYLASAGVVHRDVSPQNVFLSWSGDVKLGDFGIALAAARTERTATGIVKGKSAYMAPEQALGGAVGPRADVYGLGATLHALLTGEPPSEDGGALADAGLDPEIERFVSRLLSDDPNARPDAAEAAAEAGRLAAWLLGRDGRSVLTAWLARLRALDAAAPRSKLDDVMGLCLVALDGNASERRFTVSREDEIASRDGDGIDRDAETLEPQKPPSSAPAARVPSAIASLDAARAPSAPVAPLDTTRAQSRGPDVPRAPPQKDRTLGWVVGVVGALVAIAAAFAAVWIGLSLGDEPATASNDPLAPITALPPPAAPSQSPVPDPNAPSGYVRVGGLAIRGADVVLDGRTVGTAPLLTRVAVGERHVVVIDPATRETLLDGRYVVTPAHTAMQPLMITARVGGGPGARLPRILRGR